MNSLLVIGNGFDLSIHSKTSYSDFFESEYYSKTKNKVFTWIDSCEKRNAYYLVLSSNISEFDFTCWDLLFGLESKYNSKLHDEKSIKWCDIERVIHDSFVNASNKGFAWKTVFDLLYNYYIVLKEEDRFFNRLNSYDVPIRAICYFLIKRSWREYSNDEYLFYDKLLDELKIFERNFGSYISKITNDSQYSDLAINRVENLIDFGRSLNIDSFNYSSFSDNRIQIRHINGDFSNPIFGIDLSNEEETQNPFIQIFTKTARRLQQDSNGLNETSKWNYISVNRAVVFGHSLNKMDYDYFNYLFTLLKFNTFDVEQMGCIEFVFKKRDNTGEKERSQHADKIYQLLNYYEAYVNKASQHILINLLRFSGKLRIREI